MAASPLPASSKGPSEKQLTVLTAPLWMPSTSASSRAVAQATGTSQSFVSRTWQNTDRPTDLGPAAAALAREPGRFRLIGFATSAAGSCLVLEKLQRSPSRSVVGLGVASKRRLRTVLAADLLRTDAPSDARAGDSRRFWHALGAQEGERADLFFVVSGQFSLPSGATPDICCSSLWQWQRTFHLLQGASELGMGPALSDLVAQLQTWCRTKRDPFSWISPVVQPAAYALAGSSAAGGIQGRHLRPSGLSDDILMWLRQSLIHAEAIDRMDIPLKTISRKLGVPIGSVRSAVKSLAERGLVTIRRDSSISVRLPSAQDMTEAYLARRALGAIVIRAALGWTAQERQAVEGPLDELRDSVERDDMARAHYADLEFQLGLFATSPLERIPNMLELLTHQAFMHFAVIGVHYAFSPRRILENNCRIVEAIDKADAQAATSAWHSKMDEGLSYMEHQIARLATRRTAISR
ncbi:hypothetical protein RN04_14770 [Arthrobacter sp. W1]|nr:hypothetical protein RN04_14770 [Arthrobacter sp. W1]